MAAWPGTLPGYDQFIKESYKEQPPANTIRQSMDVGPPKTRQRSTDGPRPISGDMKMTATQISTLDTFYVTTTNHGADAFDWNHPRTAAAVSMLFAAEPEYRPISGIYWQVHLELLILP